MRNFASVMTKAEEQQKKDEFYMQRALDEARFVGASAAFDVYAHRTVREGGRADVLAMGEAEGIGQLRKAGFSALGENDPVRREMLFLYHRVKEIPHRAGSGKTRTFIS